MGMFDYVHVNVNILPVSDNDKLRLSSESFQSKDLDCTLTDIYITESGELEIEKISYEWTNEGTNAFGTKGGLKTIKHGREKLKESVLNFYTGVGEYGKPGHEWFEFFAYFEDGKLSRIERIPENLF